MPGQGPAGGFIFDIDGTLALADGHEGLVALPGAHALVNRLNTQGTPIVAYTNGTFRTPAEYQQTLRSAGLEFLPDRVLTPASVAAAYFLKRDIRRVLVLGVEGVFKPLQEAGIETVRPDDNLDSVQAVLIGWHPDFILRDLDAACRAVWTGAALFTVSNAPFFASRGGRMLGISGAIAAMITSVTGRRAIVLGKPSEHGLRIACARMGLRPSQVAVIGDDPMLEVNMARRGGARAVGVLTGIGDREAFLRLPENRRAHLVVDSLAELMHSGLMPGAEQR